MRAVTAAAFLLSFLALSPAFGRETPRGVRPDGSPPDLEQRIEKLVKDLRRRGLVRSDERTAWSVYDFASDEKLVSVNEDRPLQAASLIKPLIALAYMDAVETGLKRYTPRARYRMRRMIQDSDNASADWVMRQLGGPQAVERRLRARFGGILKDLRLVEYIPASGRTYRNKASVHDYSRFLYALWTGGLPGAEEIKRLMLLPNRDRLRTGADEVPRDTLVYDKTGSTSRLCGDMGILVARGAGGKTFPYILVGIIEKDSHARDYGDWIKRRGDVIREVSGLVYETVAGRHGLDGELSASAR